MADLLRFRTVALNAGEIRVAWASPNGTDVSRVRRPRSVHFGALGPFDLAGTDLATNHPFLEVYTACWFVRRTIA